MSFKNFLQVWGFIDKGKTVEEVSGSLPTANPGDDGEGWHRTAVHKGIKENGVEVKLDVYQRFVRTSPPPDPENWNEGSGGVWHKKRR